MAHKSDIMQYDRPALTADCVLLRAKMNTLTGREGLQVRLVRRDRTPECGNLSLVGAFVPVDERIESVMRRCVRDKAGYEGFYAEQLYTFDTPERDERWRVVSVSYIGIVPEGIDALDDVPLTADWYDIDIERRLLRSPVQETVLSFDDLAFDHAEILDTAIARLQGKVRYTDIALRFLPDTFTIKQLQDVVSAICGRKVNNIKRAFTHFIEPAAATSDAVRDENSIQKDTKRAPHRPASLYTRKQDSASTQTRKPTL